jgi:hypothetical protein
MTTENDDEITFQDIYYSVESDYSVEGFFFEPFFRFEDNFSSLTRFCKHIEIANQMFFMVANNKIAALGNDAYEAEPIERDIKLFDEFLLAAIISQLFAIFENLLDSLANAFAAEAGVPFRLEEKKMPYINKFIKYLQDPCGLEIRIDSRDWKTLDVLREVRNSFIHQRIGRDLPQSLAKQIVDYLRSPTGDAVKVDMVFLKAGFKLIEKLAKTIELAWIEREGLVDRSD